MYVFCGQLMLPISYSPVQVPISLLDDGKYRNDPNGAIRPNGHNSANGRIHYLALFVLTQINTTRTKSLRFVYNLCEHQAINRAVLAELDYIVKNDSKYDDVRKLVLFCSVTEIAKRSRSEMCLWRED